MRVLPGWPRRASGSWPNESWWTELCADVLTGLVSAVQRSRDDSLVPKYLGDLDRPLILSITAGILGTVSGESSEGVAESLRPSDAAVAAADEEMSVKGAGCDGAVSARPSEETEGRDEWPSAAEVRRDEASVLSARARPSLGAVFVGLAPLTASRKRV